MKILHEIFAVVALSLPVAAWAGPIAETQESVHGISSFDLPSEQTGSFEVSFDATPLGDKIDAFTGFSGKPPASAWDVAAIVRFSSEGTIDVRNGDRFRADQVLGYAANKVYRVRMVIDVEKKTYSVSVTPPGQPEISLARNYAFRSQQSSVKFLNRMVLAGYKGSLRVAGVSLKAVSVR